MVFRLLAGSAMLIVTSGAACAQGDPQERLRDALASQLMVFDLTEDRFEGEGATFLVEAAAESESLLIGEKHGTRETSLFTSAMLDALRPHGYSVYAIETGPVVTEDLVRLAKSGGEPAVRAVLEEHPFTAAFLFFDADRDVFVKAARDGWDVWGLDQEFIGSGRYLLKQLVALAPHDEARQAASGWYDKAVAGFDQFMKTGDQSKGFIVSVTAADLDQLDETFSSESERAQRILRELRATSTVYGHYAAERYFENNYDRIRLMKQHVAEYLKASAAAGRPDPKVVYRFGSVHMGRGYSPLDQLDLGNQAAEIAALRGGDSFHVLLLAHRMVAPDGTAEDLTEEQPAFKVLFDLAPNDRGAAFDLRALRPLLSSRTMSAALPEIHDLVRSYDAVVIFPEFHAANSLNPLPGGG